jgi:hypothetical protein
MRSGSLWVMGLFLFGWLVGCGSDTSKTVCDGNTTCNNHGTCDDSGGKAVCTCATGYDASSDCSQCVSGFHEYNATCVIDTTCLATSCSNHGGCNDTSGKVICTCDTGYDPSDYCSKCSSGYHKENSICVADTSCTGSTCNGHGTCDDQSGKAVCTCNENYDTLTNCSQCLGGYHLDGSSCVKDEKCTDTSCNGHGTCDDTGGQVVCTCDNGYDTTKLCGGCVAGYTDYDSNGFCRPTDPCAGDTSCSSQKRVCTNNKGTVVCGVCLVGYHQDASQNCVVDEKCNGSVSCNNHGYCANPNGVVVCTCDTGYDPAQLCGSCAVNYTDYDGNGICRPSNPCAGDTMCSSQNRVCINNKGTVACGGCVNGYHEANSVCVVDQQCNGNATCNDHGSCSDTGGVVACSCVSPYSGDRCQTCTPSCGIEKCGVLDICGVTCAKSNSTCTCADTVCTSAASFCGASNTKTTCTPDGYGCYTHSTSSCPSGTPICKNGNCLPREVCANGVDDDQDGYTDLNAGDGTRCKCARVTFYNNGLPIFHSPDIADTIFDVWNVGASEFGYGDVNDKAYSVYVECLNSRGTITLYTYNNANQDPYLPHKNGYLYYSLTCSGLPLNTWYLPATERNSDGSRKWGMSGYSLSCRY